MIQARETPPCVGEISIQSKYTIRIGDVEADQAASMEPQTTLRQGETAEEQSGRGDDEQQSRMPIASQVPIRRSSITSVISRATTLVDDDDDSPATEENPSSDSDSSSSDSDDEPDMQIEPGLESLLRQSGRLPVGSTPARLHGFGTRGGVRRPVNTTIDSDSDSDSDSDYQIALTGWPYLPDHFEYFDGGAHYSSLNNRSLRERYRYGRPIGSERLNISSAEAAASLNTSDTHQTSRAREAPQSNGQPWWAMAVPRPVQRCLAWFHAGETSRRSPL
ncbi:hypothetical protein GQ53DRAFT_849032 [Thozetella sp. PMI_491]|nr:hypothetical protein GQ53DRAFT_849032 [Thozetella sp. PMI_491]